METFDLESHLRSVYATFPEANCRPIIGLTANYSDIDITLRDRYYKQVMAAGAVPVVLPPIADPEVIINTLDRLDGLILTGGADYNPLWGGEQPQCALGNINKERDLAELMTVRLAYNRQIPMLGICRGMQTLALALGGKLMQDINSTAPEHAAVPYRIKHSQDAARNETTHMVSLETGSLLAELYRTDHLFVNSFHHQAVADCGKRFKATAQAPDGIIEAMESSEFKDIVGVQWHPEWLEEDGLKLFEWLVSKAGDFANAKAVHHRVLTLDTHCDTPMFFPQGVEFAHRDPRILYDLHKMTDGRQDAVTMVAYLPQPQPDESFSSKIDLRGIADHNPLLAQKYMTQDSGGQLNVTPAAYTDLIFDKIEEIVNANHTHIGIARTPQDLYENKRNQRKSIMLGIENGLAIEHDLANLERFKQRGIVYMTLCHNGDNDICDSARGCQTHGGVSPFGERVIQEMNRLGVMVDLSHGAEKSFYDALEISRVPIVCSHSNSKALCDVPRNLTDNQLRALAQKGGVAHITLYHGFLRQDGEATIHDALAHLEHFIRIMGIDHVGIGTDFDGDGGIRGLADSSELIQFTIRLLRQRYNEHDIRKIWGGNWLRVMAEVQNV
ncbi:membrane dipeptidase [Prevotella sp. A2931]|uniref:Membrane dipeptidase n=1 Tax=Prevotella illustrans TaxID=2800387 RepID=A0ABS3M594_9BACT|nr:MULTISPECIES: membrane dipeptidase [Prevotella]MBO1363343.1 membrane dipeptidase [Prevotella illustrans]PTL26977.1 fused gamma-glutamyl-gamma-aminobutyrate hydrolase/peptidase [Prevotella sp. oral taxon 820]